MIQFDLIPAKRVKLCSDERSIVGRLEFDIVQTNEGQWRFVQQDPILA
jgi:hypothetical protein